MKYCRKCGAKMTDDALFCSKCGCKVIEPKDLDVTEDAAENEQAEGNESANTPDLDLQPVVSQPVKSVSEEKSETKSSYGRTRVQYSTPSNTPPLLDELSSMYKNISRSSLILSIVDMIGTIDWILLGIAFVSWDRLLIPGILFIIYGVGMWVAAVMNFKEYLKARKVSNQLHTDPLQTLGEVIDTFRYEAENEKLFRSLSTVDTVNIFFRFYNVGKYMIKYRCINDYLSENKDSLDIILKAYSQKSVQSNNPDEELRKQKEAFSVQPKTDYQKKLKIRIRAIIVGIILIILIPVLIVLNKAMRDPEYAKYIGEKYGHTNTATQQPAKLQSYTAEEFINRYNELALSSGKAIETFSFSDATKEKDDDDIELSYYRFIYDNGTKVLDLCLENNDYSGKINIVIFHYYINEEHNSEYPYEVANAITTFTDNISFADACSVCEKAVAHDEYSDSSISGIELYHRIDKSGDYENWIIVLSDSESTSNQTDIKTEESSMVSEKETSTVQESEVSKVKETSEASQKQESSKSDSKKTIYPQGIYDRVVEILYESAYDDMYLEYSFGHIIGSDNLFLFVNHGYTTASKRISAYEITTDSVYLVAGGFTGGPAFLYVNEKGQVGTYYAYQGYCCYGMVTYEYGGVNVKWEYSSDESSMLSEYPPVPGESLSLVPVRDLSLAKEILLGKTESDSEVQYPDETLYSQKLFYYNGIIYYTSNFSGMGVSEGELDLSVLGENYKPLPVIDYYDTENTVRKIDVDSFIIINDVIYFTDQEPGSDSPPAKLYKMNLDGSCLCLLDEDVAVGFYYKDKKIYYTSNMSIGYSESKISRSTYTYNPSSQEKERDYDNGIDLSSADTIFNGQSPVLFHDGFYYRSYESVMVDDKTYYTVYYRMDKKTGEAQIVGFANPNLGGNL